MSRVNWANLGDSFKTFLGDPANSSALIKSGFDLWGSGMAGRGQERRQREEWARTDGQQLRDRGFDLTDDELARTGSDFRYRQGQQTDTDDAVLGAMGRSPLQFQQERGKMSAIADILGRGGPKNLSAHLGPFASGLPESTLKMLRPSAEAEAPYWNAVAQRGAGRFQGAGLGDIYGESGASADADIAATGARSGASVEDDWTAYQNQMDGLQQGARGELEQAQADVRAQQSHAQEKKGGGIGSFLMKTMLPLAASFIPGGPLVQMGIQGGLGALNGATGGGGASGALQGALRGGATGALNHYMRGRTGVPTHQTQGGFQRPEGWQILKDIPGLRGPQPEFRGDPLRSNTRHG